MDLRVLFLLFMIYSFIGWIIESLIVAMEEGRFMARGFFIGPYLPIFGVGAILITLLLSKYSNDIFVLFIMSCFLGSALEYVASYILEKIFNTRWWNYEKDRFNLNGRVCLSATIGFGILGVMLIMFFNPIFIDMITKIPNFMLSVLVNILALIFFIDMIVSFSIISKIKSVNFGKSKDTTEEVTEMVRNVLKSSKIGKRVLDSFPNLKVTKIVKK